MFVRLEKEKEKMKNIATELRQIAKATMKENGAAHALYGVKKNGETRLYRQEAIRYFSDKEFNEYVDERTNYFKYFGIEIEFLAVHA